MFNAYVRKQADSENESEVIYNSSISHACALAEHMFRKAISSVALLTGRFNRKVYGSGESLAEAVAFMKRGGEIRVLIDKEECETALSNHPMVEAAIEKGLSNQIRVRKVPKKIEEKYKYHFSVTDQKSFRYESDKRKCEAIAQFNNPKISSVLVERFEEIWDMSQDCRFS